MKYFRPKNPCWWAWMRRQPTAICCKGWSTAMRTFAGVLDQKLAAIAASFELPLQAVRDVCIR